MTLSELIADLQELRANMAKVGMASPGNARVVLNPTVDAIVEAVESKTLPPLVGARYSDKHHAVVLS